MFPGHQMLNDWGVKEVVTTFGSKGSVIYADHIFYEIPAYTPATVTEQKIWRQPVWSLSKKDIMELVCKKSKSCRCSRY